MKAHCPKVLISFTLTAYITLFTVVIYYLAGFVPSEFTNRIDEGFLEFFWRITRVKKPSLSWEPTLRQAVLSYSDQQIITGIAVLASGYGQLSCGLSTYHWQIVVYLAWFSSLTHLLTLTFLRRYFLTNRAARAWRAALMLLMLTMLIIALVPTGYDGWRMTGVISGPSAICFFGWVKSPIPRHFLIRSYKSLATLLSAAVLVIGYVTRLIKISQRASHFIERWARMKPGSAIKRSIRYGRERADIPGAGWYWRAMHLGLETLYVILKAYYDAYQSLLWEVSKLKPSKTCPQTAHSR